MALLATWMSRLVPLLGNSTLLDLTLPGAHDAMTYDLSTTVSDGYEGIGPVISKLLHGVSPLIAGEFVRQQGQSQGLNITTMLDNGIRFIDFRIMYTDAPKGVFDRDWYCLHGCQTVRTAMSYLREVRAWMLAHPTEVLVIWASRHGDDSATGTDAYPSTTPAQRQQFWSAVNSTFGALLFDSSAGALNATPVAELLRRGQRLVWLANDWKESTGSSARALDSATQLHNQLSTSTDNVPATLAAQAALFRAAPQQREADKRAGRLWLVSMADAPPDGVFEEAALLRFLPFVAKEKHARQCAADLHIPGLAEWCPPTLMDVSLLNNYYAQRALEAAYLDPAADLPHAIYIDAIADGGAIRTGTAPLNPLRLPPSVEPSSAAASRRRLGSHETVGYAYVATLLGANLRRLCAAQGAVPSSACASLQAEVEAARALAPLTLWNDTERGRLDNWP